MITSHLVACGLILTLLLASTETKPLTQAEQRVSGHIFKKFIQNVQLGEVMRKLLRGDVFTYSEQYRTRLNKS